MPFIKCSLIWFSDEGEESKHDEPYTREKSTTSSEGTLSENGSTSTTRSAVSSPVSSSAPFSGYGKEAAKPVLNEVASAFRNVRNNFSNKNILTSLNPFGTGDSEDEYDASGKNPFSE